MRYKLRNLPTAGTSTIHLKIGEYLPMRHSIPLLLLFLLGLLLTACSGHTGASSTPPKVSRFDAQAVFASYVGKWEVHGSLLTITAQRTGLEQWNAGPCTQSMTETRLCNGNATMTFTVNADGSIKGTIQSVWYTQWSGAPVPAGFHPDPENEQVGDTFVLQHHGAHLLYTTWVDDRQTSPTAGNWYWCDTYASSHGWQQCGA